MRYFKVYIIKMNAIMCLLTHEHSSIWKCVKKLFKIVQAYLNKTAATHCSNLCNVGAVTVGHDTSALYVPGDDGVGHAVEEQDSYKERVRREGYWINLSIHWGERHIFT
jgi:hypothetical protein